MPVKINGVLIPVLVFVADLRFAMLLITVHSVPVYKVTLVIHLYIVKG